MRQHILRYLLPLLILAALAGCQNDGQIGFLFGTWRVDSYECDGRPVVQPEGQSTFFSFQGAVVCATVVSDSHGSHTREYGTWTDDGNRLTLNFTHSDDSTPQGGAGYAPPAWMGMTADYPMEIEMTGRDTDDMTWRWISGDGRTHVYKLHKTW
ncbi:MAG: lipocalin-like domain-containing protein [Bacteroidales bacterium]|nr:lipocalin-like domain-containing protein [Bacteroidales bacterium]